MAIQPFTDEQKDLLMDYLFNKYMEDMMRSKERSEDFYNQPAPKDMLGNERIEAKSNNPFMDMISKGIKDTKQEGIMTASNSDIDKIMESLMEKYLEMGLSPEAAAEAAKKEYESRSAKRDTKPEGIMTAQQYEQGGDLNYIIEMMANETDPDKIEELKMQIREMLGTTPYMSIRQSPDFKKLADGGIVHLAPGGSATRSTLTPSTYRAKTFEDFLMDIGFTKEEDGIVRGSKGAWNKYLGEKGIKVGSPEATDELNKLLKQAGKRPYISVGMAQKSLGQSLVDEITGTETGKPNVAQIRKETFNKIDQIRLDANKQFGKNPTKKKYDYIKKQITKFFPKVAGTTALAQFIAGRALGAVSAFMPTEMGDAELYDEEGIMKLMQEQKENK